MKEKSDTKLLKITSSVALVYGIITILATTLLSIYSIRNYDIHGGFDGMNLLFFPIFLLLVIVLAIVALCSVVFVVIKGVLGLNCTINPTSHKRIVLIVLSSINLIVIHAGGILIAVVLTNGVSPVSVFNILSFIVSILLLVGSIVTDVRQV